MKIVRKPYQNQQVITRDSVSVGVESVVFWHISNPYRASFGIADVKEALIERAKPHCEM